VEFVVMRSCGRFMEGILQEPANSNGLGDYICRGGLWCFLYATFVPLGAPIYKPTQVL
jgi:hypothetical protein